MMEKQTFIDARTGLVIGSSAVVATAVISQPVFAQTTTDPLQDVQDTLTTVGTIAGVAGGIVVVSLGIRLGIKQVNRVMTKG